MMKQKDNYQRQFTISKFPDTSKFATDLNEMLKINCL